LVGADRGPVCAVRDISPLRRLGTTFKVTVQEDRGSDPVDGTLSFLSTDIGGDKQFLRRLGGHPLVPCIDRNSQHVLQAFRERLHGLRGRSHLAGQAQGQADNDFYYIMFAHQPVDILNIRLRRAPFVRFQRLSRPPKLIAERDADAFRPVIEG